VFRLALPALVALALATGEVGAAEDIEKRPFSRHTVAPGLGLGAGFPEDLTILTVAIGGRYFFANGLAVVLEVSNTFLAWSSAVDARFDDVTSQVPTNVVRLTPGLQYVLWRSRWFSPYVHGGVGPAFTNHGGETLGGWSGTPGALIGVGGRVFVDVGVRFSGTFPRSACDEAFVHTDTSEPPRSVTVEGYCGFLWGPRLGVLFAF
jgi:hypothetical protein